MNKGQKSAGKVNNSNSTARSNRKASKQETAGIINSIPGMSIEEMDNIVVTFHYEDESVRMLRCNHKGFFDSRGNRRLTSSQIFNGFMDMKHDFGAKYFLVG